MNNKDLYKAHLNLPDLIQNPSLKFEKSAANTKDQLEICVRSQKLFSQWLRGMDSKEDEFEIRGPFVKYIFKFFKGAGIRISPEFNGTIVGIALGTAIVPFLDLIAYILRLNVFKESLKNDGKQSVKIFENEEFSYLSSPSFTFVLFYSVTALDSCYGLELCQKLEKFNADKGLNNFVMHLRDSSKKERRWDIEYFKKNIKVEEVQKTYIGNVAGTEITFSKQLEEIGIPKSKIFIL